MPRGEFVATLGDGRVWRFRFDFAALANIGLLVGPDGMARLDHGASLWDLAVTLYASAGSAALDADEPLPSLTEFVRLLPVERDAIRSLRGQLAAAILEA